MSNKSKYNSRKIEIDGIKFDSKKEGRRYKELRLLERAGEITDLELQPKFDLLPTQKLSTPNGKKTLSKMSYTADFKYYDINLNRAIIEDVKGVKTTTYKNKLKIWNKLYGHKYLFLET